MSDIRRCIHGGLIAPAPEDLRCTQGCTQEASEAEIVEALSSTYRAVHAYGGREHDQPAPVEGCLLCRLEAAEAHADEMRQLAHRLESENFDLRNSDYRGAAE